MGIRITNSMVTKNAMSNINFNKTSLSTLNTQMTTQKKISRPSEDPVTAIRALRLRNNLNEINQYYERNIPDANSWLELTSDTLNNIKDVMQTMYEKCAQGANGENTTEDRQILLKELQNLSTQIYAEANADYAGRTLLTGHYTNKDLVFETDTEDTHYEISETLSTSDISSITYISNKFEFDASNPTIQAASNMPTDNEVYRIRLAYDSIDYDANANMKLEYKKKAPDTWFGEKDPNVNGKTKIQPAGYTIESVVNDDGTRNVTVNGSQKFLIDKTGRILADAGNDGSVSLKLNSAGNIETTIANTGIAEGFNGATNKSITIETTVAGRQIGDIEANYEMDVEMVSTTNGEDAAYLDFSSGKAIKCIAETGELILNEDALKELQELKSINGKEPMTFTYDKTGFDRYELHPEQYYDCVDKTDPDPSKWVTYQKQTADINYAISFNQELKVNTEASDAFDHSTNRDIEEMIESISASLAAEATVAKIKSMMEDSRYSGQMTELETMLEAAQRECDIAQENVRKAYSDGIGNFQVYLEKIETQITDVASRQNRLAVVETRMADQQMNFEELQSQNEDKDIEDIMIEYQAAYTAYQASLSATSKLAQNTLLNFL